MCDHLTSDHPRRWTNPNDPVADWGVEGKLQRASKPRFSALECPFMANISTALCADEDGRRWLGVLVCWQLLTVSVYTKSMTPSRPWYLLYPPDLLVE